MTTKILEADVAIVGSGAAGLAAALGAVEADPARRVVVATKGRLGDSGSSPWAQGGIAAAVGQDDSPAIHAADTERVGRGLNDPSAVARLTAAGREEIERLVSWGARFDRSADRPGEDRPRDELSALALGQEAGHRRRRILHHGDRTGAEIMRVLRDRVLEHPRIVILEDFFAVDLLADRTRVGGLWGRFLTEAPAQQVIVRAPATILATGGLGRLYLASTNPVEVTGDGIAMAARAGALCADLEMVQFHPTALDLGALDAGRRGEPLPLLTEALRGDGALLVDRDGGRFLRGVHADAELAPRDVVARTLFLRGLDGEPSFLDLRPILALGEDHFEKRFPNAADTCRRAGLDPAKDPIPVTPAAHYAMGGVWVDEDGRTTLDGLWACGETTASGVHGANRLASNSLLEALAFGRRVAGSLPFADAPPTAPPTLLPRTGDGALEDPRASALPEIALRLRAAMWSGVGLVRDRASLERALSSLDELAAIAPRGGEIANLILCGRMVARAALHRTESRGAHYRSDHPRPSAAWRRRLAVRLDRSLDEAAPRAPADRVRVSSLDPRPEAAAGEPRGRRAEAQSLRASAEP